VGVGVLPFALTINTFVETDEIIGVCAAALGPDWRLADWLDIQEFYDAEGSLDAFVAALEGQISFLLTFEGQRWYSEQRHYFVEVHEHEVPDGWLSHADLDDHGIDLGSWFGLDAPLLCFLGEERAYEEAQVEESASANTTPETPPTFELAYVGTQPCAEWPHYAVFELESTSIWILQSVFIEIHDKTNNQSVYSGSNDRPFLKEGECPPGDTILPPFNKRFIAANIKEPEQGTDFDAAITLCTEDGQAGECVTEITSFTFGNLQPGIEQESQPVGEASFNLEFAGTHPCGNWPNYAAFQVENTSEHTFESVSLNIHNLAKNISAYGGSNDVGFVEAGGCPPGDSTLPPNSTAEVAANIREPEPGTEFEATIKLCTQDGLEGDCVTHKVIFIFEE